MKSPRIILLSQFFPPETAAPANRVGGIAEACSAIGALSVMTTLPSYPSPSAYSTTDISQFDSERPYSIHRLGEFSAHTGGLLVRGIRELLLALRLAAMSRHLRPDIVVASSPSMFLGPVGYVLARIHGVPFVWDVRDITWGYASENTQSQHLSRLTKILGRCMRAILRRASLVVVTNSGSAALLEAQGAFAERIRVVTNGIAPDILQAISGRVSDPDSRLGKIRIAYVGLLGLNQGLETLVDAAALAPNALVTFAGDGPSRAVLEHRAHKAGLANVQFLGFIDRESVYRLYANVDVLFAKLCDAPTLNASAVPSKLYEYMATARPIVYAGNGVAADLIREVDCGIVVHPSDPRAVAEAIRDLTDDPKRRRELGRRGRDWVDAHARRDRQSLVFADAVRECLTASRTSEKSDVWMRVG
jgi:glycosyltransferase involved in cell wall biosynthesis